jgi:hypothetical protein
MGNKGNLEALGGNGYGINLLEVKKVWYGYTYPYGKSDWGRLMSESL